MSNFAAKITITAVDKVSGVVKSISTSLDKLKVRTAALGTSFANVGNAARDFGSRLRGVAVGVTALAGSIFYMSKKSADLGESLLNASQRAGVSVEELQRLRYAAEIAGLEISDMDNALKFLNKSIAEASTNAKSEAAKAFGSMGIDVRDKVTKRIKSANEVLKEMSDVFKENEDGPKKVATAFATMSRAGTNLIPLLNTGSDGLRKMSEEADRLGIILSKEQAEQLDAYGDNVQKVQKSLVGLTNRISLALVPALNDISVGMLDYISANKELLAQNIAGFIKEFGRALKQTWAGLKLVLDIIGPLVNALGGIKTIVVLLATAYLGGLIISFGKLVIAIAAVTKAMALLSIAFLANPFGIAIAAIGVLIIASYKLYKIWDALSAKRFSSPNAQVPQSGWQTTGQRLAPENGAVQQSRLSAGLANLSASPQKLEVTMKIDAEGRPKDVTAKSNAPLDFTANTGVMMP